MCVAAIPHVLVPVVASFLAELPDPVAAARGFAGVGARVRVGAVAVIAALTVIEPTVAAALDQAAIRAAIADDLVGVIALFKARVLGLDIAAADPVTADRHRALPGAGILRIGVAVVTGFRTRPDHAVSAARRGARAQAAVGLHGVAIVTLLTLLNHPISAG